jgi:hypothetical protein
LRLAGDQSPTTTLGFDSISAQLGKSLNLTGKRRPIGDFHQVLTSG